MAVKHDTLIIVPAYNEEESIYLLVNQLKQYADVCVVNDCSTDQTGNILKTIQNIHVITHNNNTHIAGTILDGMEYALSKNYMMAITIDAGFSHNPEELTRFFGAPSEIDLVIGHRTEKKGTPIYRRCLSFAGNFLYNIGFDFPKSILPRKYYNDLTSGYRRYSRRSMELLIKRRHEGRMISKTFDFLIESTMHIYREKYLISEVPISYLFTNSSLRKKIVFDCLFFYGKMVSRLH
ncbi:MAG: glycosyltransferase family 2 protein [Oligoflexia bacterium]|nr:glycosyltransferase family 2 protein [Oligoflexia bacterium]